MADRQAGIDGKVKTNKIRQQTGSLNRQIDRKTDRPDILRIEIDGQTDDTLRQMSGQTEFHRHADR
jgi:hypothetical protein